MVIIDNQQILNEFCLQLSDSNIISIDTEFMYRDTYFARLSIIQMMTNKHQVIIDALNGLDLSSLNKILIDNKILKIFHAPREDFKIFYYLFKELPQNIFDVQIATNICNFGKYLSYSNICHKICGIRIDKTYQKSNWLKRPISSNMLEYAIQDVKYLEPIYKILQQIIDKNNLQEDYQNKVNDLLSIKNYVINYNEAWRKVKFNNHSKYFIYKMKFLASYREEQAMQINIPRQHFMTDNDLIKLCQYLPITHNEFKLLKLDSYYITKEKYKQQLISLCLGLKEL